MSGAINFFPIKSEKNLLTQNHLLLKIQVCCNKIFLNNPFFWINVYLNNFEHISHYLLTLNCLSLQKWNPIWSSFDFFSSSFSYKANVFSSKREKTFEMLLQDMFDQVTIKQNASTLQTLQKKHFIFNFALQRKVWNKAVTFYSVYILLSTLAFIAWKPPWATQSVPKIMTLIGFYSNMIISSA